MSEFICPNCGNKDKKYIGIKNGTKYCRKCISFSSTEIVQQTNKKHIVELNLKYELTKEQKKISNNILYNYKNKINSLICAVCGAGKTELVYETIKYCLSKGYNIGFAVPRKDVVIELSERIKLAFPTVLVTAVYGDNNDILCGDIIVLTTHQLYRYKNFFDLLILDEIDAFPYKGNDVLKRMFLDSIRGQHIVMSATASESDLNEYNTINKQTIFLNKRYHNHPIPMPKIKVVLGYFKYLFLFAKLKEYSKRSLQCLIFTPTIYECELVFSIIRHFFSNCEYVHSKRDSRNDVILNFKNKKSLFLVTTAVLERGVTIANVQVIIFNADNKIYTKETLVQIGGRVGRNYNYPTGEVIFLTNKITKEIQNSKEEIYGKNLYL